MLLHYFAFVICGNPFQIDKMRVEAILTGAAIDDSRSSRDMIRESETPTKGSSTFAGNDNAINLLIWFDGDASAK